MQHIPLIIIVEQIVEECTQLISIRTNLNMPSNIVKVLSEIQTLKIVTLLSITNIILVNLNLHLTSPL
jgi:hypothetical protein